LLAKAKKFSAGEKKRKKMCIPTLDNSEPYGKGLGGKTTWEVISGFPFKSLTKGKLVIGRVFFFCCLGKGGWCEPVKKRKEGEGGEDTIRITHHWGTVGGFCK